MTTSLSPLATDHDCGLISPTLAACRAPLNPAAVRAVVPTVGHRSGGAGRLALGCGRAQTPDMRSGSAVLLLVLMVLCGCGDGDAEAGSPTDTRTDPAVFGREPAGLSDGTNGPGLVRPSLVPVNLREACDIIGPLVPRLETKPKAFAWFDFLTQLDQLVRLSDEEAAGVLAPLRPGAVLHFQYAGHGGPSSSAQARWKRELKTASSRCQGAGSSAVEAQV